MKFIGCFNWWRHDHQGSRCVLVTSLVFQHRMLRQDVLIAERDIFQKCYRTEPKKVAKMDNCASMGVMILFSQWFWQDVNVIAVNHVLIIVDSELSWVHVVNAKQTSKTSFSWRRMTLLFWYYVINTYTILFKYLW